MSVVSGSCAWSGAAKAASANSPAAMGAPGARVDQTHEPDRAATFSFPRLTIRSAPLLIGHALRTILPVFGTGLVNIRVVKKVCAVVVNRCNEHDTRACVDSLDGQRYPALTTVLVDDASADGSGARLRARYPTMPFVETGASLGSAGATNSGITRALDDGADYVLLVHNGTVLDPDCVLELVRAADAHADAGAVGAKILRHDAPDRIWFAGGRFDWLAAVGRNERERYVDLDPRERQIVEATFLSRCCMLIAAATLRAVGSLRADFGAAGDDAELGLRIMKSGARMLYTPAARLTYRAPPIGTPPSAEHIRLRDRNRRRVVRSYHSPVERALFSAWFYPSRLPLMARYLLQGEMEKARSIRQGMLEL